MPSAYLNYAVDSACPYHRLLCPARFCGPAFRSVGYEILYGQGFPEGHDIYFVHGIPNEAGLLEMGKVKRRGKKLVWSVDDDWLTIPDWNPAKLSAEGFASYEICKSLADYIVTSTPKLKSTFADCRKPVFSCPNLIDLSAFPEIPYTEEGGVRSYDVSVELPVKVAWVGGYTHKEDIQLLEEPLTLLLERFGQDKVAVIFQGMPPPARLMTKFLHRGLYHQPSVPYASYQKVLNSVKPNVYLAPLAEIEFNLSKSNLRIMEGWSLMAAPVATPWGEYNSIKSGTDGRFACKPEEWLAVLSRLVTDHEYRLQLATNGRRRVEDGYNWADRDCRYEWTQMFSQVFGIPAPE